MSLTSSAYGFICRKHPTGQSRANAYTLSASAATIGYGDGVILDTNGLITVATAGADIIGIFAGVQYTDVTGQPQYAKNWPGSTTGATNIVAYVYDDALAIYEVQVASGGSAYVQAAVGAQANLVANAPNATTGQSLQTLNATLIAASAQGQFRIVGFGADGPYDATTNPYPNVLVQIAQHEYVSNKVAV